MINSKGTIQDRKVFESGRILLRPLKLRDAWDVYKNIKDQEVGRFNLVPPPRYLNSRFGRIIRRGFQLVWKSIKVILTKLHLPGGSNAVKLGVILKETGKVIGIASVEKIDRVNQTAAAGFWIGKEYWGRGIMREATPLLIDYCFNVVGVHKVWGEAHCENTTSLKNCWKIGFKPEGTLRDERYIDGKRIDVIRMGILKDEWKSGSDKES